MLTVNTNIASLNAQVNLANNSSSLQTAIQRLSSGLRINSAKDDAAGYAISSRMTAQINGANQAVLNANDGASLAQTAGGALSTIGDNLQSIRTLAVQAANASNSASDRATIQNQASQLLASINSIASSTSFNGVNLLDGTFTNQTFQVGANGSSSNQITIGSISSAQTSQMGSAGLTTSANLTSGVTTAALNAGDVTLNGQQVGASLAGTGPGQSAASAYAIAQAINAVASNSGVTATANITTITGVAATVKTQIAANTFSINGINVGTVVAGGNAAGQGANVAAAINAVSRQTGVTASADATSGALTLTAANGGDISIVPSPATQATFLTQTGLASNNVGVQGGSAAVGGTAFSTSSTTPASGAGGTIAANTLTVNGVSVGAVTLTTQAAAVGSATAASSTSQVHTLTISGLTANSTYTFQAFDNGPPSGTHTVEFVATGVNSTDAGLFATAFNAANVAGSASFTATGGSNVLTSTSGLVGLALTAVRTAAQVLAGVSASLAQFAVDSATSAANAAGFVTEGSGTFSIGEQGSGGPGYNAQQLAAALQTAAITAGSAAVFSVTSFWGTGGITSSVPVTLGLGGTAANSTVAAANLAAASAATGIATANLGTQAVAGSGITVVNHGTISLSSNNAAGIVVGGAADASAGLTMGSTAATTVSSVNAVGSINLSSAAGATSALSVIDAAINSINVSAAALGALQNRFTSTVSNLQATSQNLTAARSQIQDTDFAATTAAMTRGQILQQAGTAMLAQANSLPQSVLALLK